MPVHRNITGLVGIADSPQFRVAVRAFTKTLGNLKKPRNGRGSGRWSKSRAFRPGGSLVLSGTVQQAGFPLPSTWRDQEGSIVLQFNTSVTSTLSVRVDEVSFGLDKEAEDSWRINLVCEILASPTLAGFDGTQPTTTTPSASNQELYDGLSKTHDPQGLQDGATTMVEVWPLGDTDADERQALIDIIAAASVPFSGAKVKTATLLPGRDSDAGTGTIQWARTDTAEDVVNPATWTKDDPEGLTNAAAVAEINTDPDTPAGYVDRGTTTRELNDDKTLYVKEAGNRSTKDDVEYPGTITDADVSELTDKGTITRVTSSGTPPAVPTAPEGQHVRTETERLSQVPELWRHTFHYANNTPAQDVEFGGTEASDDPSDLEDVETVREVTDSSTFPTHSPTTAGLVVRKQVSQRIGGTPEKWQHTSHYGRRTTEQDVTFPGTVTQDDASDIADEKSITIIDDSTPSAPSVPSGYKLAETIFEQLTDAGKWKYRYVYRRRTNQEAIEFDGSELTDDASDLADTQTFVLVQSASIASATPPSTPSGLKLREKSSRQIHDASTGAKWRNTYVFARRNREDDVEQGGTSYDVDQAAYSLKGRASITVVESDSTPDGGVSVSGLVLRNVTKKQLHDSKWAITYEFEETTSVEDVEFPGTIPVVDASNLADEATITVVNDDPGYPLALETPPTGLKLRTVKTRQLTNSGDFAHTAEYGRRNTEDDVEMGGSSVTDDASDLADQQVIVLVTSSGTPSAPSTPTGLKLRDTRTEQIHDTRWKHTFLFARTNREDDVEFGDTLTILDAEALESGGTVAVINTSATPPATPAAPATDTKLVSTQTKQIHGAATPKYVHIFKYGVRTSQEDIEWLQSKAVVEAGQLDRNPITVEVTSSSTAGSGTNPDSTNLSLYRSVSHRVTDTQYVHVFEWAPLTATEKMDAAHTESVTDPGTVPLWTSATECVIDGNAEADTPPTVDGLVCFKVESVRVGKAKYRHVYHYRYRSSEDELIADKTRTVIDPDGLESSAVTADVFAIASAPATPADGTHAASAALKVIDYTDLETPNPGYKVRVYRWGLTDSKDNIELPGTKVRFNAMSNIDRVVTTVEDDATAIATLAETLRSTLKSDATVFDFELERLNAAKVKKVIRYVTEVERLRWRVLEGGLGLCETRSDAFGNVQVFVDQVYERGGGQYLCHISPQWLRYAVIEFRVGKRRSRESIPLNPNWVGRKNEDEFLGLSVGFVQYLGSEGETERTVDTPHIMEDTQIFRYDSRGIYQVSGVVMDWVLTDSSVSVGWNSVGTFGWSVTTVPELNFTTNFLDP